MEFATFTYVQEGVAELKTLEHCTKNKLIFLPQKKKKKSKPDPFGNPTSVLKRA